MIILAHEELVTPVTMGPGDTTIFETPTITLDGSTRVRFEFMANDWFLSTANFTLGILDNGSPLNGLGGVLECIQPTGPKGPAIYAAVFDTPSAGDHVYSFIGNVSTFGVGTAAIEISTGWYRISEAPAHEIAFVPRTTNFINGDAQPVFTSGALAYDGATRIRIDVFCPILLPLHAKGSGDGARFTLKEDGVDMGELGGYQFHADFGYSFYFPVFLSRFLTPSAGTHTYTVEAANIDSIGFAGYLGGFLRITNPTVDLL